MTGKAADVNDLTVTINEFRSQIPALSINLFDRCGIRYAGF